MKFLPPVVQVSKDDYQVAKKNRRRIREQSKLAMNSFDFRQRATRSVERSLRLPNVSDYNNNKGNDL